MTPDSLLFVAAAGAWLTAICAVACLWRLQSVTRDAPTRDIVAQIVRGECDLARRAGDEQARGLRQELNEQLAAFQQTTLVAFSTLRTGIEDGVRLIGERLEVGVGSIDRRATALAEKLDCDLAAMRTEAGTNREGLRSLVERKLDETLARQGDNAHALRAEIADSVQRLAQRVTESLRQASDDQKERLGLNTRALAELGEKQEKAQDALRAGVENRLDAIRQESAIKLEEMRQTVDEKLHATLETRLGESFTRVVEQLQLVAAGIGEMRTLATSVGDLKNVLGNVKTRGTFGEVQLATLLEDFLTPDQYAREVSVRANSGERVEFAIRFRMGGEGDEMLLPIDAKFPREDYERLLEATTAGDVALVAHFRKALDARIKACAKDIRNKYINPPRTTDFAILFLPTEGLYAEVLRQPGLFEYLQRECRVTLAGPTTFAAILSAFQMNFRSLAIARRSSEVWKVLGAVRTEFGKYNEVVDKLGKQLQTAATSVDTLGRRTRAMNRTLRTVDSLPEGADEQALLAFNGLGADDDDEQAPPRPELISDILVPSRSA